MDLVRRLSQSGVSPALLGLPAQPAAVNQNDEAAVDAEIERLCRSDYTAELRARAGAFRERLHIPGPYDHAQLRELYASSTALV